MRFNGPVDQLRTNYSSDPSLPAADIINLLAFGTTTEASANSSLHSGKSGGTVVGRLAGKQPGDQQGLEGSGHLPAFDQPSIGGRNQPRASGRQHHHPATRYGKSIRDLLEQCGLDAEPNHPGPIPNLTKGGGERNPRSKWRLRLRHTHQENLVARMHRRHQRSATESPQES